MRRQAKPINVRWTHQCVEPRPFLALCVLTAFVTVGSVLVGCGAAGGGGTGGVPADLGPPEVEPPVEVPPEATSQVPDVIEGVSIDGRSGTYINASFPPSTGGAPPDVLDSTPTVVPGESVTITLGLPAAANTIYVGLEEHAGYYEIDLEQPDGIPVGAGPRILARSPQMKPGSGIRIAMGYVIIGLDFDDDSDDSDSHTLLFASGTSGNTSGTTSHTIPRENDDTSSADCAIAGTIRGTVHSMIDGRYEVAVNARVTLIHEETDRIAGTTSSGVDGGYRLSGTWECGHYSARASLDGWEGFGGTQVWVHEDSFLHLGDGVININIDRRIAGLCDDVTCASDQTCNPATGRCETNGRVDPCDGVNCGPGRACDPDSGRCEAIAPPDPCEGVWCGAGQFCDPDTGNCVLSEPVNRCLVVRCAVGFVCDPDTGLCVPNELPNRCEGVTCGAGWYCDPTIGECVVLPAGDPCDGIVCNDGEVCDPNTGACVATEPPDPCHGVTCGTDEVCNPQTGDCVLISVTETDWLTAAEAAEGDAFGWAVALDGDTAVIGAHRGNEYLNEPGAVYVFVNASGVWSQQARLTAPEPRPGDRFGTEVAIAGNTALISTGNSVHVFERSGAVWPHAGRLTPSEPAPGFGASIGFDGTTIVVGADMDDANGENAGAACIFVQSDGAWAEQARLAASNPVDGAEFGCAAALSGDTVVIGARFADGNDSRTGAAYIFVRSGDSWTEQAKLIAPDGQTDEWFGWNVAADGDTIVIGAHNDGDHGVASGSAYVFVRSGDTWTQQAQLTASDAQPVHYFGHSIGLNGDLAVIGAYGDDTHGLYSGAAYVFIRSGGVWTQQAKLTASDGDQRDYFGQIAISGYTAVIGSQFDDHAGGINAGSAYVFDLDDL